MAGLVEKFKEMWTPIDEEEYEDEQENKEGYSTNGDVDRHKIVSFHAKGKPKVILVKPEGFDERIKEIADGLLENSTMVLNLEEVVKAESRRIVDFLSGVAYANGGKMKKVATDTFVITPCNVDFEGSSAFNEFSEKEVCF